MDRPLQLDTLERIVPDDLTTAGATAAETLKLHVDRYAFAKANLKPGTLLDIACGAGYGTALLCSDSPSITRAIGADISAPAIAYASGRYGNSVISFQTADAMTFEHPRPFENVVSLETIEHVPDPRRLFSNLVALLAPGGRLIASVPVTPSVDANPHHRTNFTKRSFRKLGEMHGLRVVTSLAQIQPFSLSAVVTRSEPRTKDLRRNMGAFYLRHPSHLALRIWSTFRYGFTNHYLTIVWEKP